MKNLLVLEDGEIFGLEDFGTNFVRSYCTQVVSEELVAYQIDVFYLNEEIVLKNEVARKGRLLTNRLRYNF